MSRVFHRPIRHLLVAALVLLANSTGLLSQDVAPESSMAAFGKMIPAGFINRSVIIPSFDQAGKKTSELHAVTLTRIDEERLQATQVSIHIFAADPAQNMRIDLPSATFHLADHLLRSGEHCTVTRADLQTSADSLVFDTRTSIGSMSGRVRTLIFDTSTVSHDSKADQPAKAAN
jgi:hypothetical protein